mmetsp:Transcript_30350/g.71568  ORF Transcript_30350/g.71568 Transcript_30350/m.71568 type:complete len:142 (-) Transcript_30350:54-479(-)
MEGTMRQAPRAAEEGPRILPDGPVFRGDVTNDKGSPGTDGRPPKQPSPISVRRDGTHGNNPLDDDDDDDNSAAAAAADSKAETKQEGTLEEFTDVLDKLGFECVRTDRTNTMFLLLELKKNGKKPDADLEFSAKPCIYKRR